jgi:isopentenyl-diphosphate Delta-isomerase
MDQNVVLVNEKDEEVGLMEKMRVHREGLLHRAFSVFVFDRKGRMLLQKRSPMKYHGGNLWSNACCSHPYPNENVEDAAKRRLKEELGFVTPLHKIFEFVYKADVENNLIEHEYDHVFAGEYEGVIRLNEREVSDYCFENMSNLKWMIKEQPHKFTSWFKLAFPTIETWWEGRKWFL